MDADNDLAATLLSLEAQYGRKRQLARVLGSARARQQISVLLTTRDLNEATWRASPLANPALRDLWNTAAKLTDTLLQVDPVRVRQACARWTGGKREARFVVDMLYAANGVAGALERQARFLRERAECLRRFAPERARVLASATPFFAAALRTDTGKFRTALRELRALARAPLELREYGFGEISRVVGTARAGTPLARTIEPPRRVYKRLAPFPARGAAQRYVNVYAEYNRRLRDEVGIVVPDFSHSMLTAADGSTIVFCTQALVDPRAVAKEVLLRRDVTQCRILLHLILREYRKLIRYNRNHARTGFQLGLDGQVPNWAVCDYAGHSVPLRGDEGLIFLDTNTPMMRTHGQDCLPLGFYLQALPRVARPLVRPLARRVLDRYFNPRTILLDFLANVSIHGRTDLLDPFLPEANAFLAAELRPPQALPIAKKEVEKYIAEDIATWRLTRSLRKVEEMFQGQRGPLETARQIRQIYTRPIF